MGSSKNDDDDDDDKRTRIGTRRVVCSSNPDQSNQLEVGTLLRVFNLIMSSLDFLEDNGPRCLQICQHAYHVPNDPKWPSLCINWTSKRAGLQTEDNVNTRSIFQLNGPCGGWKLPSCSPQSHTSSSPDVLSDAISASLLLFVACNDVHASVPDVPTTKAETVGWLQGTGKLNYELVFSRSCTTCKISLQSFPTTRT